MNVSQQMVRFRAGKPLRDRMPISLGAGLSVWGGLNVLEKAAGMGFALGVATFAATLATLSLAQLLLRHKP